MHLPEEADSPGYATTHDESSELLGLLSSGSDWWNNACIGYANSEWSLYARGYKRAAEILVRHIDEKARDQDTLVYPILFLYRQCLELRLKHAVDDACVLLAQEFTVPGTHRLAPLFKSLMTTLATVAREYGVDTPDPAELQYAAAVFHALDAIDPKSMTFRYPEDLNGQRLLPDVQHINVRHFRDRVARTSTLLEAIDTQLSVLDDLRNEWASSL